MPDLFGFEPPIVWDEAGRKGKTRDGRAVEIEHSLITQRLVAVVAESKTQPALRRSRLTAEDARRDIERAVAAELA